jgi:prefoldin subunit 2
MADAGGSSSAAPSNVDQGEVIRVFQNMMGQREQLTSKISELTVEHAEYKRVAETLKTMDGARRCHQLLNGVLVERTVGEVVPSVTENRDMLDQVVKSMTERLSKLIDEMKAYQQKFNRAQRRFRARARAARATRTRRSPPTPLPFHSHLRIICVAFQSAY